jgi:hypothetical protein
MLTAILVLTAVTLFGFIVFADNKFPGFWSAFGKTLLAILAVLVAIVMFVFFTQFVFLCIGIGLLGWGISSLITDAVAAGVRKGNS